VNASTEPLRVVIVGGVAGGATAAARARRSNATAKITLLEKGAAVSFANCGLPYHLGGEIAERKKLLVATPELFRNRFQIEVRTGCEATAIDRSAHTVTGVDRQSGLPFTLPYDRLILATGSQPLHPDFLPEGVDNVFHLWTLDDMDAAMARIASSQPQRAVVLGAGFIGLEVVEQLHRIGLAVSLVEAAPHVLGQLDPEMTRPIEQELARNDVQMHVNAHVARIITEGNRVVAIELEDGQRLQCDLLIVGVGATPRIELAREAGLVIGKHGGVSVNQFMQTSDPSIYAVGDIAEVPHGVLADRRRVPLAGPANRAGRIAGAHAACGASPAMGSVLGTSIVRVFDLVAATTGINEHSCRAEGLDYRVATIQAADHASYYPGANELTVKLIYAAESGRILGAQVVGRTGVDKRIDIIATAMHFKGTVHDLAQVDLAYSPPFGSAKDPVHMAAFVAQNDLLNHPRLLATSSALDGYQVVDVRSAAEIERLPLEGARHIPIDQLAARWQELDPAAPTVVVCHSGKRAHVGACWLSGHGFADVSNLNGGVSIRRQFGNT
jgi:NADPH-dependent 2,4-dienoyl-CoA reductase/sulfur reductase-like enzyme/rhodanese-related sulfurtransferase